MGFGPLVSLPLCRLEVSPVTCLPPSPFPAEAWVGAQQLDALEASLDPSRGALPGGVGGPMLEPIGIGLVCHLHTHPSISPQSSWGASCCQHIVGEPLVGCAALPSVQSKAPSQLNSLVPQSSRAGGAPRGRKQTAGSDPGEGSCFWMVLVTMMGIIAGHC